jgi:hypothetical protein
MSSFPVYIKYSNNKNFFKIISSDEFEELTILGNKFFLTHKKATIHPDRVFIADLLNNTFENTIAISEDEYNHQVTFSKEKLERIG